MQEPALAHLVAHSGHEDEKAVEASDGHADNLDDEGRGDEVRRHVDAVVNPDETLVQAGQADAECLKGEVSFGGLPDIAAAAAAVFFCHKALLPVR